MAPDDRSVGGPGQRGDAPADAGVARGGSLSRLPGPLPDRRRPWPRRQRPRCWRPGRGSATTAAPWRCIAAGDRSWLRQGWPATTDGLESAAGGRPLHRPRRRGAGVRAAGGGGGHQRPPLAGPPLRPPGRNAAGAAAGGGGRPGRRRLGDDARRGGGLDARQHGVRRHGLHGAATGLRDLSRSRDGCPSRDAAARVPVPRQPAFAGSERFVPRPAGARAVGRHRPRHPDGPGAGDWPATTRSTAVLDRLEREGLVHRSRAPGSLGVGPRPAAASTIGS